MCVALHVCGHSGEWAPEYRDVLTVEQFAIKLSNKTKNQQVGKFSVLVLFIPLINN